MEERIVRFDKDLEIEAYRFKGIMQRFPNHFHEYYVIGFIESGKRHLSCKNKEYIVSKGDLLLFNPMDNHTCEQIDENTLDYRCINVKPEIMKKVVYEVTGKSYLPKFSKTVSFHSELILLLRELHQEIMEQQISFKKEEIFLLLMEQLIENDTEIESKVENEHVEIQKICDFLDGNYTKHITLEDLSALSDLNKYSLIRLFTKCRGITPYRYLETVRINEAKKLLERGVAPIDAAMETGFVDQSHFTNYFKEFIGVSPKQYQNIFEDK